MNDEIIYKEESYKIIGICMEIHKILGKGFLEIVYKDALEIELKRNSIPFEREKPFLIKYKEIILPHKYHADFIVYDKIILEIKCKKGNSFIKFVLIRVIRGKAFK
jgi:GxxExxY protein